MSADCRVWAFCAPGVASAAQAALTALGRPDMAASFSGRYPFTSTQLHYAGWQGPANVLALVEAALGAVAGVHLFRGAVYGLETEKSPDILQEGDVGPVDPLPLVRCSWRACVFMTYRRLGLGAPPAADLAPGA